MERQQLKPRLHVILADIHYPVHNAAAIAAVFDFIERNRRRIASVTLLGDFLDCENLSRHTVGKPRLRERGGYRKDIDGFRTDILDKLDALLPRGCRKIAIAGNHCSWIQDALLDAMPELEGTIDIPVLLELDKRGWEWKNCGEHVVIAGFVLIHGDQIGSGIHVAKKMVDSVNENCVMGHVHRFSVYTRTALVTEKKKQLGVTLPCLCTVAPTYAKGQPNAFVNGFGVLEEWAENRANLYVPIIMDGQFSYGGKMYGGERSIA